MKREEQEFIEKISREIEIPTIVEDKAQEAFRQIKGGQIMEPKNRFSIKKAFISVAAVAAIALVISAGSVNGQVYAGIKALSYDIGSALGINKDLEPYKTVVNQTKTADGVSITLNEVVLDGDELIVSSIEDYGERKLDIEFSDYDSDVYINGRLASYAGGGGSELIDEHKIGNVLSYILRAEDLTGDLDVEIKYYNGNKRRLFQSPSLTFEFHTSGNELALATKSIQLDQEFVLEDGTKLTAYLYSHNVVSDKIRMKADANCDYDLSLRGTDNLGNPIEFWLNMQEAKELELKALKFDKGVVNEGVTSMTLQLYAVERPKESGKMNDDFKLVGDSFTITLDQ